MKRGFTIVEIIVTITIMGILLTLAVVNINSTQLQARDDERKADIAAIKLHLESWYKGGSPLTDDISVYPNVDVASPAALKANFPDADDKSFTAPNFSTPFGSFIAATNNDQSESGVSPSPDYNQYVYQPLKTDGTLCNDTTNCRKYNLYYRLEADNTVYKVMSKN